MNFGISCENCFWAIYDKVLIKEICGSKTKVLNKIFCTFNLPIHGSLSKTDFYNSRIYSKDWRCNYFIDKSTLRTFEEIRQNTLKTFEEIRQNKKTLIFKNTDK